MSQDERQRLLKRPQTVEETGLSAALLAELTLKLIYNASEMGASEIARGLKLPFLGVVQPVLEALDREESVVVTGTQGFGAQAYHYTITRRGLERVHQALERSGYIGAAPVPLDRYNAMICAQSAENVSIDAATVRAGFRDLIVSDDMLDRIGPALNSGRSVFLYGPPGNGKTTIAEHMARLLGRDPIYIPYAVAIDNHIIKVYDSFNHRLAEPAPDLSRTTNTGMDWASVGLAAWPPENTLGSSSGGLDERWVSIERPALVVGGELTMASLDLIWDPTVRYYEAPFQMKANGGMFLIDDFGRQQINPRNLLNRWIIPLETRVDYLRLHTGKKIEVPFRELVVFSTNLNPTELMDEAFLRRIRHKIKVDDPTEEEFHLVFKAVCAARGVIYTPTGFRHLVEKWYHQASRSFKNSHPRDIAEQLLDIAGYRRIDPVATPALIDAACTGYFADL